MHDFPWTGLYPPHCQYSIAGGVKLKCHADVIDSQGFRLLWDLTCEFACKFEGPIVNYFFRSGRRKGRTLFATILLPSAVAWVRSACIMPSTPKTPLRRNGSKGTLYFFSSRV